MTKEEAISGELKRFIGDDSVDVSREAYEKQAKEIRAKGRKPWPLEMWRSILVWQKYASPVWMDINQSDTLQYRSAREDKDEKHIAPLQLQVIARGIELWSNPGDIVLSPFAGIGSEGYEALKMGRRFVGVELKESYYQTALCNLRDALADVQQTSIYDFMPKETVS